MQWKCTWANSIDVEEWGILVCHSPWGCKESELTGRLNNSSDSEIQKCYFYTAPSPLLLLLCYLCSPSKPLLLYSMLSLELPQSPFQIKLVSSGRATDLCSSGLPLTLCRVTVLLLQRWEKNFYSCSAIPIQARLQAGGQEGMWHHWSSFFSPSMESLPYREPGEKDY